MSQPLDGCTVAIGGTFPGQTQAAVSKYVRSLGATVSSSVTKKTTHLITTDADFSTNAKVRAAETQDDCRIVSLEWAEESERAGAKADDGDFAIGGGAPNGLTQNGSQKQVNGSNGPKGSGSADSANSRSSRTRKRAATDGDDQDDDPALDVKKQKAANGKKTAGSKKKAADDDAQNDDDVKEEPRPKPNAESKGKGKGKEVVAEGQIVKSKDAVIPIDEGVTIPNSRVYIDDDGVIFDASLNQTNAGRNNNKFYRAQLLQSTSSFNTWTRWGRVGEYGQSALLGSGSLEDALKQFEKKFKDKSGLRWADRAKDPKPNKYAYIERNYDPDSDNDDADGDGKAVAKVKDEEPDDYKPPTCTLEPAVQRLMELIFNSTYFAAAMTDLNYDAKKLPLGKLGKSTILRGFQALKDLAEILDDPSVVQDKHGQPAGQAIETLSNLFYTLIPHDFGRHRPPVIHTDAQLKKEIQLLESLSDMKDAAEIMKTDRKKVADEVHPLDNQFRGLGLDEMSVLDHESSEFKQLSDYLQGSKGSTHRYNYQVDQIFRIERQGEKERFDKSTFASIKSDKRLLWHGSRCTNFGGILSQGLRIAPPEAPVSGYMFGKGIYLADMSSKSAGYCNSYSSGGHALLLLCEAELGDPMLKLTNASYEAGEKAREAGSVSTWGMGRMGPSTWKDAGCVHPSLKDIKMPDVSAKGGDTDVQTASLYYNEYIAYNVAQVKLRYLFRVKM